MEFDPRRIAVKTIDAVAYAVVLTGVVFLLTALVSYAAGGGLPGSKWLMFFLGFAMLGYASLKLRPKAAWKDGDDGGLFTGDGEQVGIAKAVSGVLDRVLPPRLRPGPNERPSNGTKLFLAAVGILLTSFLMEVALGINY
ncbi:hypothetical protein ACFQJC_16100 [Haloferax namakaokahaiae]|uniref:Uncharacterized protein n=1 Tax=Haloferax namakaokahaiae TaxID=1748331 RepID=A0ABD5ZIK0_9EURY